MRFGSGAYRTALPVLSFASDYVWFAASAALFLTLPMVVEIQRETTVLVMQRQREAELAHRWRTRRRWASSPMPP